MHAARVAPWRHWLPPPLGGEPATARALGTALELAELLYDLGLHARRDRLPLPLEELARFNVPVADILHGKKNRGVSQAHGI